MKHVSDFYQIPMNMTLLETIHIYKRKTTLLPKYWSLQSTKQGMVGQNSGEISLTSTEAFLIPALRGTTSS